MHPITTNHKSVVLWWWSLSSQTRTKPLCSSVRRHRCLVHTYLPPQTSVTDLEEVIRFKRRKVKKRKERKSLVSSCTNQSRRFGSPPYQSFSPGKCVIISINIIQFTSEGSAFYTLTGIFNQLAVPSSFHSFISICSSSTHERPFTTTYYNKKRTRAERKTESMRHTW